MVIIVVYTMVIVVVSFFFSHIHSVVRFSSSFSQNDRLIQ